MHRTFLAMIFAGLLLFCGCGNTNQIRGTNGSGGSTGGKPGGGGGGGGGGGTLNNPAPVTLANGQSVTGVDITVVPAASAAPPNALVLGATDVLGSGSLATSTGAKVQRGTSKTVFLFGAGLSSAMTIRVDGPSDITVSNLQDISAQNGTPGVAFTAAVSASADLGCRTVILQAANNDVTTFTGGLEIVP